LLEERVCILEKEQENNQQTIKELRDKISSCKRSINKIGDYTDDELGEPREKVRKYRHLGTREEPIVLELRGKEIYLRTGRRESNHSSLFR
jgi:hypothetical protein